MPAISVLTKEEWREVRSAVEAGVPMREVAKRYDVEIETLTKRAQREKWATQTAREKAFKEHLAKSGGDNGLSTERPVRPSAITVIAATRAENVEILKDEGIKWGVEVVRNARKTLTTPNSFADVKAAVDVAAKLAGIGNDGGASVTVLFGGSPAALETRAVDVETVQSDSDVDSQICDDLA